MSVEKEAPMIEAVDGFVGLAVGSGSVVVVVERKPEALDSSFPATDSRHSSSFSHFSNIHFSYPSTSFVYCLIILSTLAATLSLLISTLNLTWRIIWNRPKCSNRSKYDAVSFPSKKTLAA